MSGLEAIPWKDFIAPGGVAAVIGIIALGNTIWRQRVRLTVRAIRADGITGYCIEVVNLSSFPITIREAGFCRTGESGMRYVPETVSRAQYGQKPNASFGSIF